MTHLNFCGYCCINCNAIIQTAIHDSIYINIFVMLSSFIVLTAIILALLFAANKNYNAGLDSNTIAQTASMPLTSAAMILGIGIGGFIDGIVLHQVLQWHEMLSNKLPPDNLLDKNVNTFWDGIFHLFTLVATMLGIYLLWKLLTKINTNKSGYLLAGGMLLGWGLFNMVEEIINHQLLQLHNVREFIPNKDAYNYGFLLFSLALLLAGKLLVRKGHVKMLL